MDGSGTLQGAPVTTDMAETGQVTVSLNPTTVLLDRQYNHPVVFAQSSSYFDAQPVVTRVRNVQTDRFTIQLQEPANAGNHHAHEVVTYLVVEQGQWLLENGTLLEVGTVDTSATVGQYVVDSWESISFVDAFQGKPLVVTQTQTVNAASYVSTRQTDHRVSGFKLALEQEEAATTSHAAVETVGYLALEQGVGKWSKMTYEAGISTGSNRSALGYWDAAAPGSDAANLWEDLSSTGYHFSTGAATYNVNDQSYDFSGLHEDIGMTGISEDDIFDFDRLDAFTIVAYYKAAAIDGHHTDTLINKSRDNDNNGWNLMTQESVGTTTPHQFFRAADNSDRSFRKSQATPDSNSWHMVMVTVAPGDDTIQAYDFYRDGSTTALTKEYNMEWDVSSSIVNEAPLKIGYENFSGPDPVKGARFAGQIGFIEIWDEQLPASYSQVRWNHGNPLRGTDYTTWVQQSFNASFRDVPGLLSALTSYNGADSAHVRYHDLSHASVQFRVEEDTSYDLETTHTTEEIGFLAIGGSGTLAANRQHLPPQVTQVVRNAGNDTYDALNTIAYTFNEPVTVSASALSLSNASLGHAPINLTGTSFSYDASQRIATWNLSGLPQLPAAWYTATLATSQVIDSDALNLDGDGNGIAGGSHIQTILVAKPGDANLNGFVDILDFNTLALHFDPLGDRQANDWSSADFDGDNDVDMKDFYALTRNFAPRGYAMPISLSRLGMAANSTEIVTTMQSNDSKDNTEIFKRPVTRSHRARGDELVDRAFADPTDTSDDLFLIMDVRGRRRVAVD